MSAGQGPLVSVVTPVYNGEPYLRECIESILAQTYTHWDYTIVNNCSTDKTREVALAYAARDRRIRVHDNEAFVPVIANYNIAFRQISAESKYCKVVAADDLLFPECLERMTGVAEAHPRVAIVGAYGLYSRAEMGVYCRGVPYSMTVLPGRDLCRSYLLGQGPSVWGSATFVLFRSAIVRSRHSFLNESNIHADSEVCLEFLREYDFGFVHQILTVMRVREGSLTSMSHELNTHLPHRLYVLKKYGHLYLSERELGTETTKVLRAYYRYLAWQAPKRRGREFWAFHRRTLAELGYPLKVTRLAGYVMCYGVGLMLSPQRMAKGLGSSLGERWAGGLTREAAKDGLR